MAAGKIEVMPSSRRAFLAVSWMPLLGQEKAREQTPGKAPERSAAAPTEWRRYADPATEFEVVRLTDPGHESMLPAPPARAVDRRSRNLLFCASRGSGWQPWLMDLGNGEQRPLGIFQGFEAGSCTLSGDDREAWFSDGAALRALQLSSGRQRELARLREGWTLRGPLAPSEDGTHLFYVEQRDGKSEVRRLRAAKGAAETVAGQAGGILETVPNPRRATLLWRTEAGELWVCAFDGAGKRRVQTPPGKVLEARWSPDGQSLLYLLAPEEKGSLPSIREQGLDGQEDRLLAKTSQFVSFEANANASVFVGASRSLASPMVLVLLRATRREFTLCEHRAGEPARVLPRFTPNSQRVLFQSDRHGRSAIYMLNVEKLIEKTDT